MMAMILAAGRGERMRPLTDTLPKPLLRIHGTPLIERLIRQLVTGGFTEIVINIAHLGHLIKESIGYGQRLGARIYYSDESPTGLETGGGIAHALPLLKSDPFIVVNGDIFTDYPFSKLPTNLTGQVHLVLVDNPPHHRTGDFALHNGKLANTTPTLTFSGIGVYRKSLFKQTTALRFPLAPLLREAIERHCGTGEYYPGLWTDVGTPDRLAELNQGPRHDIR